MNINDLLKIAVERKASDLHLKVGSHPVIRIDGELHSLAELHPATEPQLFGPDGSLNRYVNVYLNDEDVRVLDGLDTGVGESDTLVILPAMAGG